MSKNDRIIESGDVADYCAKMCRELSELARAHRLELLEYLLVLAKKEAEGQVDRVKPVQRDVLTDAREVESECV